MLLCSLSCSYENFVNTMMFGREVLTLEKAKISLNSKELKKKIIDSREGNDGVGLVACGRLRKRESKGKNKSHFK